jgi:outer membrane protein TolC
MLKMRKILVLIPCLLLFLLTSPDSIKGQDTVRLTLEEVIRIAQAQSPDALIAEHTFRVSYWQYRRFKAQYLPRVEIDGMIPNVTGGYRQIPVPDGPDIFQYNSFANARLGMTIDQRVGFTGGSVFLRSQLERLDNYFLTDSVFTQWSSVPVIVGYSQPIFQYNEYRWDKQIEPLKYEKAKRKYLEDMEQVAISATNRFFNLLLAQIDQEIALKNLNHYDTLYKIAQGRYNLGKIAENELLQLELNYLNADATLDQADLDYENRLFQLKSYLRLKDDSRIELIPAVETPFFTISSAEAIVQARKNTSTALDFDERLLTAESQVRQAKMDGRFDADLYLEYGLTQSGLNLGDAYSDPQNQQNLRLGFSVPIIDWGVARGNIRMAESNQELEVTAVEQEIIDFEQNIYLEVMQFAMQEKQIRIAAKSDTVAQKRFNVTQQRYMIGKINDVLELNQAQIENDQKKRGYYQALRNYWTNYYEIRKLTLYDFMRGQMLIFDIRQVM